MHRHRTVVLVVATFVAVACGGAGEDAAPDPGAEATSPAPVATEEETTPAPADDAASATVAVASSELGDILVDGDGMVLYLFTPDEGGTPTCTDDCAANWPPLAGPAEAGDGADAALLGSVTREDGSEQVTYGGWPLYHFAGDEAPGDTNGQGINDVWFVVDPSGNAVEAAAMTEADAGGY